MAPEPQSVEPERRTLKARSLPAASEQNATDEDDLDGPFQVTGRVMSAAGDPIGSQPLMWSAADPATQGEREVIGQTNADGHFDVRVPEVGFLSSMVEATPERVHITKPLSGVEFLALQMCPIDVIVYGPDGLPIPSQAVRASVRVEGRDEGAYRITNTNAKGVARMADTPCGVAKIWVRRKGYPQGRRENIDTLVEQRVVVRLVDGLAIRGTVTNPSGEPIENARVRAANASDRTDDAGRYGLLVDPRKLSRVEAQAQGHASESERLRVEAEHAADTVVELDFTLEPARIVTVHCAGLADDSCESIVPLMCTSRMLPVGAPCFGAPTECNCPEGAAAIRGAGMAVEVNPEDSEVWLDLRDRGGLRGRVTVAGRPVDPSLSQCSIRATRLPEGLEDISGGLSAGAQASCLPDGEYELLGLKPGSYMLVAQSSSGQADKPNIEVGEGITEVGTIDIGGGGRIEGVVLDGVTGEGAPGHSIVAFAGEGDRLSGIGQTTSRTEGRFAITGLDDGTYEVMLATRPFHTVSVEVHDATAEALELTTGEAGILDENGFALETDDEGLLVVSSLDSEGSAASNGLQEGDIVRGVSMAGMNLNDLMPSLSDEITDTVLDHWGGPGVSLVIERDGEEMLVGMD